MAALQLTASGVKSNWSTISYSNPRAVSHYIPFSCALIAALQLITFGNDVHLGISGNNQTAVYHYAPFSQALMAAPQLI